MFKRFLFAFVKILKREWSSKTHRTEILKLEIKINLIRRKMEGVSAEKVE